MKKREVKQLRKSIDNLSTALEEKLQKAGNKIDVVRVYKECEDLIEEEISKWLDLSAQEHKEVGRLNTNFLNNVTIEIKKLQDVLDVLQKERNSFLDDARELYEYRAKSGIDDGYVKYVSEW